MPSHNEMLSNLLVPEVSELIRTKRFRELRAALSDLEPADVADLLAELDPGELAVAFRILPRDVAAEALAHLDPEEQESLLSSLPTSALRAIEEMEPDDRADLIDELPPDLAKRVVESLSPEERRRTQIILGYPPESVGRLMTPDYIRLRPEWTVSRALEHIRRHGRDAEVIHWVYVVDAAGRLVGDLRIRSLLFAEPDVTIESLTDGKFIALHATDDQEEAVRQMARYDRTVLPVLDSRGVLLGIVTADDVADVAEEEATEDIQMLGGMEALDAPYMQSGLLEMFRKRGVWLAALFAGQTVTVPLLGAFQDRLAKAIVLTLFIPLVISCGGNSGSQAATLVTRALALDEIRPRQWLAIIRREIATGLLLGVSLGALGALIVLMWHAMGIAHSESPIRLGATIGVAVLGVVTWGSVVGSLLPLVMSRLGWDPAVASTPLVATLMDASGMLIYFGLAILILSGTLL